MKRINCILIFLILLLGSSLYAQSDSIISASGEVGDFGSNLDFLNEAGNITLYPRLTDAGELLYYAPIVSTDSMPSAMIGASTATIYGNILFNGWCETVEEQGFQISTIADFSSFTTFQVVPDTTYADCDIPCPENVFSYSATGLTSGTTYYVRAYATNSVGTAYGSEVSFTTLALPTVTTTAASNIGTATATSGGNVTADGGATVTARGVCWSTSHNPTISNSKTTNGSGTGSFTSSLTGLTSGTTYYVRAYATNSVGTAYGSEISFTTLSLPTVTTTAASNIGTATATSGGNVTADGGATVTARGVCWSTSHNPTTSNSKTTNGSGTGSFTSSLTGLTSGTTYYVRAYATNSVGTAYGNEVTFTTTTADGASCGVCQDYDGNTYNTVQIGNQCWMKSNLRTTHYADGSSVQYASFYYACHYDNLSASSYGYQYSGSAAMKNAASSNANPSGVQGVCPNGWHLPSKAEWNQLVNYVGSQSQYLCGTSGIAAALATSGWGDPGSSHTCSIGRNANNATGFSARPTIFDCVYMNQYVQTEYGNKTLLISSTKNSDNNYVMQLRTDSANTSFTEATAGAVRCVRN
ncbi:MAG: hypothetical protein IJT51_02690 [Bacteroidales bacterium]|nr:hypothetical protein [Bacteroidales bacterium]